MPPSGRRGGLKLWGGSLLFVLAAHAALASVLLSRAAPSAEGLPSDAISIDLTPEMSATALNPEQPAGARADDAPASDSDQDGDSEPTPPAPDSPPPAFAALQPPATEPEPFPPVDVPDAEILLPRADQQEKSAERAEAKADAKPEEPAKEARLTVASRAQEAAAAAAGGGGRPSPAALATWRSRIALQIERFKRYPADAAARRQEGMTTVRFTLDAEGRVLARTLVQSSRSAALDQESLAMILRAQPLPAPPPGLATPVSIDVPVRFSFR